MIIDREVVLQIANLAHVELSESEIELFTKQLQDILTYIEQLKEINNRAEPFSFSSFLPSITRVDIVQPSLPIDDALRNAPDRIRDFFRVPRIIP